MDTLTNLENVFSERRIDDEDLPSARHKDAPKDRRNNKDNTHVEHNQVCWVAGKETWHHFLLEKDKPKSFSWEDIVFQFFDFCLRVWLFGEHLFQIPIVIGKVIVLRIAVESQSVVGYHCWISSHNST